MGRIAGVILLAVAGGAACASEPPPVVVRDSAGVRVVVSRAPGAPPWTLGPPTLDVGDAGAALLADVVTAFLAEPGLVVVDGSQTVRFFDRTGAHVGTAGGRGGGPGEFEMIAAAGAARGDSVWAYDYAHRRVTVMPASGGRPRVTTLRDPPPALLAVGRLPDGRLVLASSYLAGSAARPARAGLRRDTVPYVLYDRHGEPLGLIGRFAGREYVVGEEGGRFTMATPPFARAASHAVLDSLLVHGDRERREVRFWSLDGRLRTVSRWAGPDLEVGPEALAEELDRRLSRHGDDPGLRRFLAELPRPGTRPAYGPILTDDAGRVWIAPADAEDGGVWTLLRSDGVWLADVVVPDRFRPLHVAGDEVVGVWRDALDVEHVEVRPLLRPRP